jgi:hypothetical protein
MEVVQMADTGSRLEAGKIVLWRTFATRLEAFEAAGLAPEGDGA